MNYANCSLAISIPTKEWVNGVLSHNPEYPLREYITALQQAVSWLQHPAPSAFREGFWSS